MTRRFTVRDTHNRLLAEALDVAAADRDDYLDSACDGNPKLRAEMSDLLSTAIEQGDILTPGGALRGHIGQSIAQPNGNTKVPDRIGPFRIVREIGRGGMSVVYQAAREHGGFDQQVAIKLILPGADSDELLDRFSRERRILASLNHSGIARLFDGGWTEDGQPYFTMELVDGLPIDEYCRQHDLDIEKRLDLFKAAAEAVAYAHSRQVVHRDLKPSNILVDRVGQIRLLDFGIAKLLDKQSAGMNPLTRHANGPLTLEYASPEQVRGDTVTVASDVYQLGVLLYELLTDCKPYPVEGKSFQAMATAICEQTPTLPSAVVRQGSPITDSSHRVIDTLRRQRQLRGDLDTIVMKALRKEARRRYTSAAKLSEDVGQFLANKPVSARKDSVTYLAGKFLVRHSAASLSIAIAIVAVAVMLLTRMSGSGTDVQNSTPLENSVAVLPFEQQGAADTEQLGDSIASALINELSAVPQLRIIARASSFNFRESEDDVTSIAQELGVSAIVSGSVKRTSDQIRISTRLIDGTSGAEIWARTYEHDGTGTLRVQNRISKEVFAALSESFEVPLPEPRGPSTATTNADAYQLYLIGQHHYLQRGDGVEKSIDLFKQATELDPDFAHAWAGLAAAYSSALTWGGAPDNVEDLIREAGQRAIELDEYQGRAYMSVGGIDARKGRYKEAADYLFKALAVSPNDPTVLLWSFEGMLDMGRSRDALQFARRLHELHPVSQNGGLAIGFSNLALGNSDTAERFCDNLAAQGHRMANRCSFLARIEQGNFDAAAEFSTNSASDQRQERKAIVDAYIAARKENTDVAIQSAIDKITAGLEAKNVSPNMAFYYLVTLGTLNRAFELHAGLLGKGFVDTSLWWLPSIAAFRQDPRFVSLAARAGLVEFWRHHGWADACSDSDGTVRCQ